MAENKKYYWLKLKRDFFKRHDIEIIEGMPNGKDYVLFYLKLLVESIDHEGALRFSETLPYNEEMLATITRTNVDIVRSAVKVFSQLGMMDMMDDGTLYMRQLEGMIGDETEWAAKKRVYREQQKGIAETPRGQIETESDKSKSLELERELELDKDNNIMPDAQAEPSPLTPSRKSQSKPRSNDTGFKDDPANATLYHSIYDPILERAKTFSNYGKEGNSAWAAVKKLKTKIDGRDLDPAETTKKLVSTYLRLVDSGQSFWAEITPSKFSSCFEQIWAECQKPTIGQGNNRNGFAPQSGCRATASFSEIYHED